MPATVNVSTIPHVCFCIRCVECKSDYRLADHAPSPKRSRHIFGSSKVKAHTARTTNTTVLPSGGRMKPIGMRSRPAASSPQHPGNVSDWHAHCSTRLCSDEPIRRECHLVTDTAAVLDSPLGLALLIRLRSFAGFAPPKRLCIFPGLLCSSSPDHRASSLRRFG
jgi:hypothetical protein